MSPHRYEYSLNQYTEDCHTEPSLDKSVGVCTQGKLVHDCAQVDRHFRLQLNNTVVDSLGKFLVKVINPLGEFVLDAVDSLAEFLVKVINPLSEFVLDAVDSLGEFVLDAVDSLGEFAFDTADSLAEVVLDAVDSLAEVCLDTADSLAEVLVKVIDLVVETFEIHMQLRESSIGMNGEHPYGTDRRWLVQILILCFSHDRFHSIVDDDWMFVRQVAPLSHLVVPSG